MPQCIRGIDGIMGERQRDTLLLEFPGLTLSGDGDSQASARSREMHFEWFKAHDISWEIAAPRGWLEGDPGIYALDCEPDDPRIASYSAEFETPDGISLDADAYQMIILKYDSWREHYERLRATER